MKFIAMSLALLLVSCASQPDYRAATHGGGFGYTETQLSDSQFRVHFKARGSDRAKAMDYAMLRAAEVTLQQGYEWFAVVDRETLVDKQKQPSNPQFGFSQRYARVTECGVISCRTAYYPTNQFQTGIFVGGEERSEIESVLNIQLGRGDHPESGNIFDASQVKTNLAPKANNS